MSTSADPALPSPDWTLENNEARCRMRADPAL